MKTLLRQWILILLLGAAIPAQAHLYPDFDHSLGLTLDSDQITLEYRIWYGPALVPGLDMDTNLDHRLDPDELFQYMNRTDREIRQGLAASLDNIPLDLKTFSATISDNGTYPSLSLDIALWYVLSVPRAESPNRHLEITDTNFAAYGPERKILYINTASRAADIRISREGTVIRAAYAEADTFGLTPGSTGSTGTARTTARPEQDNRLTRALMAENLGPAMLLTAFVTAFILGAGHALSPGHGKAMVAAYLVGTRGRRRDAVLLGLIVTFTHVISVITLGLVVLYLSSRILPEQIYPWLSVASGILIFFTGFLILARRGSGHDHAHPHDHGHLHGPGHSHEDHAHDTGHSHPEGHPHAPTPNATGLWGLLSMGIAGGMVPCPSAMVVLLVSISLHKIALGLALIIVFSFGLASVLIAIGIAVVSMAGVSTAVTRFAPVVRFLPVLSAGLVLILGIAITGEGLMEAGIIRLM